MTTDVATDAPVKGAVVTLRYVSDRPRRLSSPDTASGCWASGGTASYAHRDTKDAADGAMMADNAYARNLAGRVVFAQERGPANRHGRPHRVHRPQRFAGRPGGYAASASRQDRRGLDPCAAMQGWSNWPRARSGRRLRLLGAQNRRTEAPRVEPRFGEPPGPTRALEGVW